MSRRRLAVLAALVTLAIVFAPSQDLAAPAHAVGADPSGAVLAPTHDAADTNRATSTVRSSQNLHIAVLAAVAFAAARWWQPAIDERSSSRPATWTWDLAGRSPPGPLLR